MLMKQCQYMNDFSELSHSMAHYLLVIHQLKESKGYARITDMAKELGLTKGSVSIAVQGLKKRGLIEEEQGSRFLVLTEWGHKEVHKILSARTLLFYFLKDFVGVDEETSKKDSCGIEHLLSDESRSKLFMFIKKISRVSGSEFKTGIDFSSFSDFDDFVSKQTGNTYLSHDGDLK